MNRRTGRRRADADGKNRPRIRRSTVALCTFFVLTLAVYLLVRPNPVAQAHRVAPPAAPAATRPATPRATATPKHHSARPSPSATRSSSPAGATPPATASPSGTAPAATPSPTLGGTPTVGSTPSTP